MILKQGHEYRAMPHDGKVIRRIYRGGRCYYIASPYSPEATQALKAAFPQYWTAIIDYGYAHPQLVPFINEEPLIAKFLVEHSNFGDWVVRYDMHQWATPRLAIDADDAKDERKWLIRAENNYTDWYLLDNVLSQTNFEYVLGGITPTNNYVSKVGNTAYANGTIVKFFIPTTMPTGYSEWFADGMTIYINGQQVIHTTAYHNNRKDVTFDFSPYIKLNEMNYIILRWWGSGSHGFDFGLLG